jgi:hypothetical protein
MFLMAVGICSLLFCRYIKIKTGYAKKSKRANGGMFSKTLTNNWLWQAAFCFSVPIFSSFRVSRNRKSEFYECTA